MSIGRVVFETMGKNKNCPKILKFYTFLARFRSKNLLTNHRFVFSDPKKVCKIMVVTTVTKLSSKCPFYAKCLGYYWKNQLYNIFFLFQKKHTLCSLFINFCYNKFFQSFIRFIHIIIQYNFMKYPWSVAKFHFFTCNF